MFRFRRLSYISLLIFLFVSILISVSIQATQGLFLNRIGFCNVEVGYDVHVVGNKAYVTNNDGLMIINTQDPHNPNKVGELLIGGSTGFVINGSIAYIASVLSGFVIANVSNPVNPEIIGSDTTPGADKIAISGKLAYVSYAAGGFFVFNISIPESPQLIGSFSDTRSDDIQVKDEYVFFANAEKGLRVVNVADPSNPYLIQTLVQTSGANDIFISDNILYLARWGMGIKVFDITNPISPLALDSYDDDDGGEELGLVEKNALLYVADNSGVEVFNVSDPNSIFKVTPLTQDVDAAHDVDVDSRYIYVAMGGGLLILEVSSTLPGIEVLIYMILISAIVAVISIVIYYAVLRRKKRSS